MPSSSAQPAIGCSWRRRPFSTAARAMLARRVLLLLMAANGMQIGCHDAQSQRRITQVELWPSRRLSLAKVWGSDSGFKPRNWRAWFGSARYMQGQLAMGWCDV